MYRFTAFRIPTRSDSHTTLTNSIHIRLFQLLCTSQLNSLGLIQTIMKADTTMNSTHPVVQPSRFNSIHSSLNWTQFLIHISFGRNNLFIKDSVVIAITSEWTESVLGTYFLFSWPRFNSDLFTQNCRLNLDSTVGPIKTYKLFQTQFILYFKFISIQILYFSA